MPSKAYVKAQKEFLTKFKDGDRVVATYIPSDDEMEERGWDVHWADSMDTIVERKIVGRINFHVSEQSHDGIYIVYEVGIPYLNLRGEQKMERNACYFFPYWVIQKAKKKLG